MTTQTQVRKALLKLSNIKDFVQRHENLRVSERTIYRQRTGSAPPMRQYVIEKLAQALILEGLLLPPKPKAKPTTTRKVKRNGEGERPRAAA